MKDHCGHVNCGHEEKIQKFKTYLQEITEKDKIFSNIFNYSSIVKKSTYKEIIRGQLLQSESIQDKFKEIFGEKE
jgi:hypothetical protein